MIRLSYYCFLKIYLYPFFLFCYSIFLSTIIEYNHPEVRWIVLAVGIPLIPASFFTRETKYNLLISITLVGTGFFWLVLSLKNLLIERPEGINLFIPGALIIVFLAARLYDSIEQLIFIERSFLLFATLNVIYAILFYLVVIKLLPQSVLIFGYSRIDIIRISGIYTSPIALGPFLIILLNYLLFCRPMKALNITATITVIALMLFTANRSSFLLLLISLTVFSIVSFRQMTKLAPVVLIILFIALFILPSEYYLMPISRVLTAFAVIGGDRYIDQGSFAMRFSNNAVNLDLWTQNLFNFFFGPGYAPRVTDSDMVTMTMNYGLFFTVLYYGLFIVSVIYFSIPKYTQKPMKGLRIFLVVTTFEKILEGIFIGGVTSPGVAAYYFAFLGAGLAVYRNQSNG